jgi:hypothetical protein
MAFLCVVVISEGLVKIPCRVVEDHFSPCCQMGDWWGVVVQRKWEFKTYGGGFTADS